MVNSDIDLIASHNRHGDAAGNDRLDCATVYQSPSVIVDEIPQLDPEPQLEDTRTLNVAADTKQGMAGTVLGAFGFEPVSTLHNNGRHLRHRLAVIDGGRAVPQATHRRKR